MEIAIVVLAAVVVVFAFTTVLGLTRLARAKTPPASGSAELAGLKAMADAERASLLAQLTTAQQAAAQARDTAARAQDATAVTRSLLTEAQAEIGGYREATVRAQTEAAASGARLDSEIQGRRDDALRQTEEAARVGARVARVLDSEIRLGERETRLAEREDRFVSREERLAAETDRQQRDRDQLIAATVELDQRATALIADEASLRTELERVAGLSAAEATTELIASIEDAAKRKAAITVRDIEAEAKRSADARAREVVSQSIQRVASAQTTESVVAVVHLPGDDMKGRIIGREGRNIRTFETITGVNVLIDDTPEAVTLSCFDPVRREVARVALDALVADGRIHPQRIEDAYTQAKDAVEATIALAGQDALIEVGLAEAHPDLVTLLGRLKYRTSYGQNVLRHLVETAH